MFSFKIILESFNTGIVSPVKLDSSTFRLYESINLQSAGTKFPASSNTISPGTTSVPLICIIFSSLFTFAIGADIFLRASKDFSALAS